MHTAPSALRSYRITPKGIPCFMQWLMQMLLDLPVITCLPDELAKH